MAETTRRTRFRGGLWLIRMIGGIVPRRLRADSHPVEAKDLRFRSPQFSSNPA